MPTSRAATGLTSGKDVIAGGKPAEALVAKGDMFHKIQLSVGELPAADKTLCPRYQSGGGNPNARLLPG